MVCFSEKSSIPRAKARAITAPSTFTGADYQPALDRTFLQCRLKVPFEIIEPSRSCAFLRLRKLCNTAESMRGMLIEGRGGAPVALL